MRTFDGARVTVMGLGRFDGGYGVTRWLTAQGASVLVTDTADATTLRATTDRLRDLVDAGRVTLRLGGHDESDFTETDLVVVNPAVPRPWTNAFLAAARNAGVPITTEIRLLVARLDRTHVIGVTGTAGKSTTAAMLHHILAAEPGRRAHLGGNIGGSLLPDLASIGPDDWVVLELSSAMLHWLGDASGDGAAGWSPRIAVLTTLAPNHLDWHETPEHYEASKKNIFAFRRPGDQSVRGDCAAAPSPPPELDLALPGAHNRTNAALAIEAAHRAIGVPRDEAARRLASFAGLPHRLCLVGERNGVRAYDDSKSTTPEAALLAVAAFDDPSRVHLIAGGFDKGLDLEPVARLAPTLAGLYTIGATGEALADAAPAGSVHRCTTLERAVTEVARHVRPSDVILLSPACASWDQFDNYEARGAAFTTLVQAVLSRSPSGAMSR